MPGISTHCSPPTTFYIEKPTNINKAPAASTIRAKIWWRVTLERWLSRVDSDQIRPWIGLPMAYARSVYAASVYAPSVYAASVTGVSRHCLSGDRRCQTSYVWRQPSSSNTSLQTLDVWPHSFQDVTSTKTRWGMPELADVPSLAVEKKVVYAINHSVHHDLCTLKKVLYTTSCAHQYTIVRIVLVAYG